MCSMQRACRLDSPFTMRKDPFTEEYLQESRLNKRQVAAIAPFTTMPFYIHGRIPPGRPCGYTSPSRKVDRHNSYIVSWTIFNWRERLSDTRLRYTVLMEQNEDGGYTVTVPSLPGCVSEGSTWEEALGQIEEAIAGYIEVARKLGKPIPVEVSVPLNTTNAGT